MTSLNVLIICICKNVLHHQYIQIKSNIYNQIHKKDEGLGFKNLPAFNNVLLGKQSMEVHD